MKLHYYSHVTFRVTLLVSSGALSVPLCYASGARGGCKPLGAKQHGRIDDDWFGTQAYLLYSMDRATGAEVYDSRVCYAVNYKRFVILPIMSASR